MANNFKYFSLFIYFFACQIGGAKINDVFMISDHAGKYEQSLLPLTLNIQEKYVLFKLFRKFFIFDNKGNFIGIKNHLVDLSFLFGDDFKNFRFGFIRNPPYFRQEIKSKVDLVAHWYNDFGLQSTLKNGGARGALTWYYWDWARNKKTDLNRHPLLGWYKGDQVNVLGWQTYWLLNAGIKAVNLATIIDFAEWSRPESSYFWTYQLFNKVPNFKKIQYILWLKFKVDGKSNAKKELRDYWEYVIGTFSKKYKNIYKIHYKDRVYPVFFLWEGEGLRGVLDNYISSKETKKFLISVANYARKQGYEGICLFVRHPTSDTLMHRKYLLDNGVLYLPASYSKMQGSKTSALNYSELVNTMKAPSDIEVVNVVTAHHTIAPHPSGWQQRGSTPLLFKKALEKAFGYVLSDKNIPDVIQIYNVSEWAEGGPGLQPNMKDFFRYLEVVNEVIYENN